MKMIRRRIYKILPLALALCLIISATAYSQDIPERPVPQRLVNDFAGMLTSSEVNMLESKLVAFDDSTSTQIAVVTVPSLMGYDRSDYAQRLAEKWGIGQRNLDNGVLILVKPRTDDSDGQVFIAQGYGLEGAIPDITCAEIIDNEILPAFRSGYYYTGLDDATTILMALASGEFSAAEYGEKTGGEDNEEFSIVPFIIILIVIITIISGRAGGSNRRNISRKGLPFWLLVSMMGSGRSSHSGSWGGFSGGGGGGFGGFGGGSFGGGGAGGSW